MKGKAILLCGAVLSGAFLASSASAQLTGDTISVAYNFPTLGNNYSNYSASPSTFTVGNGVETTLTVDGFQMPIDFSASALTIAMPSVGWTSSPYNGPVFTNLSHLFPTVTGATGIDLSRISVTGNQLAINWSGMAFNQGDHVTLSFAGGVPEPATWALLILGFGAIGMAMRRRNLTVRTSFG